MKDFSELVKRLSDTDDAIRGCGCCTNGLDAAAAILAHTARVKELEEALKPFADNLSHAEGRQGCPDDTPAGGMNFPVITNGHLRRARVALSGKGV